MIDYFKLLNARDRGINGVRVSWEKCETEYNNARGVECYERSKKKGPTGATMIHLITDWIASDQSIVRPMIEASAAQYAKEKGITPRDCGKEG